MRQPVTFPPGFHAGLHWVPNCEIWPKFVAHSEIEVLLQIKGQTSHLVSGNRHEMQTGSVMWLFPGTSHTMIDHSKRASLWICIFRPPIGGVLWNQSGIKLANLRTGHARELDGMLRKYHEYENRAPVFNAAINFWVSLAWDRTETDIHFPAQAQRHPAVQRAVDYIEEHPECLDLQEVARYSGLSAHRLSRLFNREMDVSFTDFRNSKRVEQFLELRKQDVYRQHALLDLALEAGFGSYAQFHRAFRKQLGVSPSAYHFSD